MKDHHLLARIFRSWCRIVLDHPRAVVLAAAGALAAFVLSILHLRYETELESMIPTESGRVLEKVSRAFGIRDQSFLIVESPRPHDGPALVAFARAFAAALEGNELIAAVSYGLEDIRAALMSNLIPYAPRYAQDGGDSRIEDLFSDQDLDARARRQLARLSLPGLGELTSLVESDPLDLGPFLWSRFRAMKGTYRFDPASAQFLSEDGRAILIRIEGRRPIGDLAAARATADAIEEAVRRAGASAAPGDFQVHAGGAYFLACESEAVVRGDLLWSLTMSAVLTFVLIAWIMRSVLAGLLVMPPLLLGIAGGIGVLGFTRSTLTTLALASASIEVGLSIDFAIHLMQAAIAERARGRDARESVEEALTETGPSLFFAAMTTVVAFLAFPASRFTFLSEMGLVTAIGVVISLLATVSVLPPLLRAWLDSRWGPRRMSRQLGVGAAVNASLRSPGTTLALIAAASGAALVLLIERPPALETDLRNIHARNSRALAAEKRLEEVFGGSQQPLLALLEAGGEEKLEEGLRSLERPLDRLVADGLLAAHASAGVLLPPAETERRAIRRLTSFQPGMLRRGIDRALDGAGLDPPAVASAVESIAAAAADRRPITLERLREIGLGKMLGSLVRPDPDRPGSVLGMVTLFPSHGLWSGQDLAGSLARVREALAGHGVKASLTGLAVVSTESANLVVSELSSIGGLTVLAVGALTVLQFRRPGKILLAFLPMALGCLWTAALFQLLDYRLNFMNASVLPMIIGIGIDSATHLLHRYSLLRSEGGPPETEAQIVETFRVTGGAAALSSILIMVSFGSLAFSSNRGLASIGVLSFIGIGASLAASITFLPALLAVAAKRRAYFQIRSWITRNEKKA